MLWLILYKKEVNFDNKEVFIAAGSISFKLRNSENPRNPNNIFVNKETNNIVNANTSGNIPQKAAKFILNLLFLNLLKSLYINPVHNP